MTGAGWGGCTVSMVPKQNLKAFMDALEQHYYQGRLPDGQQLDQVLFSSEPGCGAAVLLM